MRLENKVAIVTGGAGKIGKAFSLAMAKEGAKIVISDVMPGDDVVKQVEDSGGEAMSVLTDVADETSAQATIDAAVERFGRIDILVNNAAHFMQVVKGPFWEIPPDDFDKAMAVNVRGVWLMARAAVPHLIKNPHSKIINLSSGVALAGTPNYIHYVGSKGAVIAMTRAMANELGQHQVCVNSLSPGFTMTEGRQAPQDFVDMVNSQRAFKRTEVESDLVGTLLYLASPDSDFVTGQMIIVDGGMHLTR